MRLHALVFLLAAVGCTGKDDPAGDDTGTDSGDDTSTTSGDGDGDGYTTDDCDDTDATVHPGAEEVWYDGVDQNCDGNDDDQDLDGYASPADCNDANSTIHPEAKEVGCDGIDQDCDGQDLVVDGTIAWTDADGDGHGDAASPVEYCGDIAPEGTVATSDDCDDADAAVYPAAVEVCNGVDDDCNGAADDAAVDTGTFYADGDGDGFGDAASPVAACSQPEGYVASSDDCDDGAATTFPGASETCNDVDDNCDGVADDGVPTASYFPDGDGDGHGVPAGEVVDCVAPRGYAMSADDCDDAAAAVYPGADETCNDVDDDCDGVVDEDAVDARTWYEDLDDDGYGGLGTASCTQPDGTISRGGDCDDDNATIKPTAPEVCDDIDEDCDGLIDEAGSIGESTWYADADGDGYGDPATATVACSEPPGYTVDDSDCDDTAAVAFPGGVEADDTYDNDCDGWVDEDFLAAGALVITEVARQPWVGTTSTVDDAMWFEVYNPSASRTLVLDNFYVIQAVGTIYDAWLVDPADGVILPPGGYAVFCASGDYEGAAGAALPLGCDYTWGDPTQPATYEGYYHDNTFNLQRDEDVLSIYVNGGTARGTLLDTVHWTYDAAQGYWPRDATFSMQLDPAALDATSNDRLESWCSTPYADAWVWWTDGTSLEFGSPGVENPSCGS